MADVPATAADIHAASIVLDAHADIVLPETSAQYLGADGRSKVAVDKLRTGNVGAVVMAAAVGPGPRTAAGDAAARDEVDRKLAALESLVAEHSQTLTIATTAAAVREARAAGRIALIPGFQNARALGGDLDALNELYAAGVRVFALNHIGHNDYADSSRPNFDGATGTYEPAEEHGGLSELGRAAVQRINDLGAVLDVSQSSRVATLSMVAASRAPVIASHSNARSLSAVSRNLSDAELDAIADQGGVVHVVAFGAYLIDYSDPELLRQIREVRVGAGLPAAYAYPYELYWEIKDPDAKRAFLTTMRDLIGPGSVQRMVDHVDYLVQRMGIDHVGIGSDFNHGGGVDGFREADEALNITGELLRRGYSAGDIARIWGGNFLRVLDAAAAAAEATR
ncbi:MAG: membrane dipeptidase [Pseudomonadota bacterium]